MRLILQDAAKIIGSGLGLEHVGMLCVIRMLADTKDCPCNDEGYPLISASEANRYGGVPKKRGFRLIRDLCECGAVKIVPHGPKGGFTDAYAVYRCGSGTDTTEDNDCATGVETAPIEDQATAPIGVKTAPLENCIGVETAPIDGSTGVKTAPIETSTPHTPLLGMCLRREEGEGGSGGGSDRFGTFADLDGLAESACSLFARLRQPDLGAKGEKPIPPAKADELVRRWLVTWKRPVGEIEQSLAKASEWLSDNEAQRSATARGAVARVNRAVNGRWGVSDGEKPTGKGKHPAEVRAAWRATADFAINRVGDGTIFDPGVIDGFPHRERLRSLLHIYGKTKNAALAALNADPRWQWTLKNEANVQAEVEINGG